MLYGGSWYKAEVLAKRGGKYLVRYLDYGRSSDEWVGPDRIKPRGAPAPAPMAPPPAAPAAGGGKIDGLYYRHVVLPTKLSSDRGGLRTYPFWFLPDGNVLGGDWGALLAYIGGGLERYKKEQTQFWGTYQLEGSTIVVTWSGGREERFETEPGDRGLKIKGLLRAHPLKEGLRLDGKYVVNAGKDKVSIARTYLFRPDMTLRFNRSEYSAESNGVSGGEAMQQGTYLVAGYALIIKYEQSDQATIIWTFDEEDARSDKPRMLCIGENVYQRQD